MNSTRILTHPLDNVAIDPWITALPKADIHVHQEEVPRLERIVARRKGRPPYDWNAQARSLMAETPPGMRRFAAMYDPEDHLDLGSAQVDAPDVIRAKIVDILEESAANGALLAEVIFGANGIAFQHPDFMALFRDAEQEVQARYPNFYAEAIALLSLANKPERFRAAQQHFERFLAMADEGLAGINFLIHPYDTEADPALWDIAYRWTECAAEAGLGITAHTGEFSTANVAATLRIPGLRRIGHAVHAGSDADLLAQLAESSVTVEVSLTCNVILGATPSYKTHPIRRFVDAGIPVTLNTDNPVRIDTTIAREYAVAAALGFSQVDLLTFTRNAIKASFTSDARRTELLKELRRHKAQLRASQMTVES